jgi:hypothetical protein
LETWTNLSLDPSSNNYIKRVIGDQKPTYVYNSGDPYIEMSGGYENKSSYVRVDDVTDLLHYLDDNGEVRDGSLSSSLPPIGSGSIGGAFTGGSDGEISHPQNFYNDITETNSQGFDPTACTEYEMAINLLGNKDEYDINMLLMPGISYDVHSTTANNAVQMCENRADCIYIMDPAIYNSTISTATDASAIDSSYAAAY